MRLLSIPTLIIVAEIFFTTLSCSIPGFTAGKTPTAENVSPPFHTPISSQLGISTAMVLPLAEEPKPDKSPTPQNGALSSNISKETRHLKIVFIDCFRNLWIWNEGNKAQLLTKTGDVIDARMEPKNKLIAFIRSSDYRDFSMWVINDDGSNEHMIISPEEFNSLPRQAESLSSRPFQFEWKKGTRFIIFNTSPVFEGPGSFLNNDLWVVNADDGDMRPLLLEKSGGMFKISPDAHQIAISQTDSICVINSDGSNMRCGVLRYNPVNTYSEWAYYAQTNWAPDSSFLRTCIPPAQSLDSPGMESTCWQIPVDGSKAQKLGSVIAAPLNWHFQYSPDLEKIAYIVMAGNQKDNIFGISIANADGSNQIQYHSGAGFYEVMEWNPDSRRFVYNVSDDASKKIFLGEIGAEPLLLSTTESFLDFEWVDNNRFLLLSKNQSGWDLQLSSIHEPGQLIIRLPDSPENVPPVLPPITY